MTKEQREIIETINNIPALLDGNKVSEEDSIKISVALVKAIQALEQMFDPMSEKEAIKILNGLQICNSRYSNICQALEMATDALKQESKTGQWIKKEDAFGDIYYNCSVCGESWSTIDGEPWNAGMPYCPNCGVRMIESQERSEKNE